MSRKKGTVVEVYRKAWAALPDRFRTRLRRMGVNDPSQVVTDDLASEQLRYWEHPSHPLSSDEEEAYVAFLERFVREMTALKGRRRYEEQIAQAQILLFCRPTA